ncbi:MAG: DNA-binding transcriptional regulator [Clostridiales bacterium]|jgi:predicted DNA-binding transcriptional regulator YafY|nr:DNA-binding transcriptional regulator [Clostridiales bacterium]
MKIDRLLGILTILAQNQRVKAKDLAKRFEVSLRTIHRDIEYISMAGIPIVTYPGGNGGICIADGFTMDKSILTSNELQNIILGLKSLDSVMTGSQINTLLSKLLPESDRFISFKDDIVIDLATYYKNSLAPKISLLRQAISNKLVVQFEYYSKNGKTKREFDSYFITFKWSAWYVFGFCRLRSDFRLFKLNRIINLELTDNYYTLKDVKDNQSDLEAFYLTPGKRNYATLLLDRSLEYVMVDTYGQDSYEIIDVNTIMAKWDYINEHEMVKTILSLGGGAKVIAPPSLVDAVKKEIEKIINQYK